MKEHNRLALARKMMERKLEGRRSSSSLPDRIELVMAKPLVSAGMVTKLSIPTSRMLAWASLGK
ncbi:hypothetical protein GGQ65_005047 [Rhizobium fabae]|uniref:Uncharacterized protein n=1 Tax=Rhizobium fabae TaxID=573179 RepID=A0A7W6BBW1_9HYPH|nr:hypothetical protein [Rhizobium fabae]